MADDAWKQHLDLLDTFTQSAEVRKDLRVTAHATDRAVELIVYYPSTGKRFEMPRYHTTGPRNVGTMRELANAILAACDFVDESNPTWAARRSD